MSDGFTGAAPYRVTFKGQSQTDPWLTVEGANADDFRYRLSEFLTDDEVTDEDGIGLPLLVMAALVASKWVGSLNAQEGISDQRDRKASQPAVNVAEALQPSPTVNRPRPSLSSSLEPESDGSWWIAVPYTKDSARAGRWRDKAKDLQARYKPDEAPESVPRKKNGQPERPWCVHPRFVSEEQAAELLHLHETGFQEIA